MVVIIFWRFAKNIFSTDFRIRKTAKISKIEEKCNRRNVDNHETLLHTKFEDAGINSKEVMTDIRFLVFRPLRSNECVFEKSTHVPNIPGPRRF